jgi:DNA-binding CsgD family transcriptional regulator/catechol 2,3-dioxygenase-like lactoylglutathione lyase family enzyme
MSKTRTGKTRGRPPHDDVLTPAEWRVVNAVRHGMTNAEIARRRRISLDAVKYHVRNAVAKLGLENRNALKRWRGTPQNSPIGRPSRRRISMTPQAPLQLGEIGQIARSVGDIDAACTWYGGTLGLKHLYTFGKLAFFDCGGVRLYLSAERAEPVLYLRVADILAAYDELQRRGVVFLGAPHMVHRHADGTEEWLAFFKDPDGRPLALISQVRAQRTVEGKNGSRQGAD